MEFDTDLTLFKIKYIINPLVKRVRFSMTFNQNTKLVLTIH